MTSAGIPELGKEKDTRKAYKTLGKASVVNLEKNVDKNYEPPHCATDTLTRITILRSSFPAHLYVAFLH